MKVTKRGFLGLGSIAIASAFVLTGCQATSDDSGDAPEGGTLTVWVDAERVDALQGAADAYEEKTGVKVQLTGKSVDDMKDDFIQQVPTGKGPDIVMGAHDWLGELSTNGVVAPIELGDSSEDYLPVALQAATYDGTVYMLPYAVENIAVLRNADLVPAPATSFDDMISKGKFVVEQGTEGNPYHLYPFQTAFGAPVFGTDDTGSYDSTDLQLGSEGGFAFADWLGAQGAAGTLNTDIDGESTFDDAGDETLLPREKVIQDLLALRIANLLQDHLLRRLGADAADFQITHRLFDVVAELRVGLLFQCLAQHVLTRRYFELLVRNDLPAAEEREIAVRAIDRSAYIDVFLEAFLGSRSEGEFERAENSLLFDILLARQRVHE